MGPCPEGGREYEENQNSDDPVFPLLAISCSGSVPTVDLTVRNDSDVAVGYSMDTVEGTRIGVLLPSASKLEKDIPQGDAALATVGNDSEIVLTMGEAVPKSIYSSIPGARTLCSYSSVVTTAHSL